MMVYIPKIAFCHMVEFSEFHKLLYILAFYLDTTGLKPSLKFNPTEMNQEEKCSGRHKGEIHQTKGFTKMGKHPSFSCQEGEQAFIFFF